MSNKTNRELALEALMRLKDNKEPPEQKFYTPYEFNEYYDTTGSNTTEQNKRMLDSDIYDELSVSGDNKETYDQYSEDVEKQKATDVLKLNKLKELLNRR
jgi:hypothetical protein